MIYFVQNSDTTNVKIGYSHRFRERLVALNVGNDSKLIVLRILHVRNEVEQLIFNKFNKYNIKGEWFSYNENLKRFIEELPGGNTESVMKFIEAFELKEIETGIKIEKDPNFQLNSILKRLDTALIKSRNSGFTEGIRLAQEIVKSHL